jgi:hypothetical protein
VRLGLDGWASFGWDSRAGMGRLRRVKGKYFIYFFKYHSTRQSVCGLEPVAVSGATPGGSCARGR